MTTTSQETVRGQWFFSTMSHALYDAIVYKFVIPYIWRCSPQRVIDSYRYNLSKHHLEIGVGTGYALNKGLAGLTCCKPTSVNLSLMDLNSTCLRKSAGRLAQHNPRLAVHNTLRPFTGYHETFKSVGLHFVMHCIPGDFIAKGRVFKHIAETLKPNGIFFGATVLGSSANAKSISHHLLARVSLSILNALGIFHNSQDILAELKGELEDHFSFVEIDVTGSIAHWRAVK